VASINKHTYLIVNKLDRETICGKKRLRYFFLVRENSWLLFSKFGRDRKKNTKSDFSAKDTRRKNTPFVL
jgi:hypothetical protein